MKKQILILISGLLLVSCTSNNDVERERVIQDANVKIAKEKTEQVRLQWKSDSLKSIQSKK